MQQQPLEELVQQYPFEAYYNWWPLGREWSKFMSRAIVSEWRKLSGNEDMAAVNADVEHYIKTVYKREARPDIVKDFTDQSFVTQLQSGEFDALSYGFYKSAFTMLEQQYADHEAKEAKRQFTRTTGRVFFSQVKEYLDLNVPMQLADNQDFSRLKMCIQQLGKFLQAQGYLRDYFAFTFETDLQHAGQRICQAETEFVSNLNNHGMAHAVYEMGYPVVLPSAVYLYHSMGEAQHHSSRMIEEFFALTGHQASETDDFDPVDYPVDRVVELWEIKKA